MNLKEPEPFEPARDITLRTWVVTILVCLCWYIYFLHLGQSY